MNERLSKLKRDPGADNPLRWAQQHGRIDGAAFSLKGHAYLKQIFEDWHPDITLEKASQMAATIWALNARVFYPCDRWPVTSVYYFPTDSDVQDFSKGRVKPMIEGSEYLSRLVRPQYVDSVGLKRIGKGIAYFRGMKSSIATKSIPADFLVFDELDEAEPAKEAQALKRLSHSKWKYVVRLSTPSIPDYGIDSHFQKTDQRYWLLRCPACDKYNFTEEDFPENIQYRWDPKEQKVEFATLVCIHCKKPLDTQRGKWVAEHPSRTDRRGYHLSQLYSTVPGTLKDLMKEYLSGKYRQIFFNHCLGLPYIDAKGRITIAEVKACVRDYQFSELSPKGTTAGIDQGDILHMVIGEPGGNGNKERIVWMGELSHWEEVDMLMRRHEIKRLVIDALPNKDSAKRLASRFPGRVFLCYYDKAKGDIKWDDKQYEVHVDRTETIDGMMEDFRGQEFELPNVSEIDEYAKHLYALVKKQEEDEESGEVTWRYIKTGPDHFAHATNYFRIAFKSFHRHHKVAAGSMQVGL